MRCLQHLFLVTLLAILLANCERNSTVTIRPDGSCHSLTEMTFPRAQFESQVRQMDMLDEPDEDEDEDVDAKTTPTPPAEATRKEGKPAETKADDAAAKDAELEARIRKAFEKRLAFLQNIPEQARLEKLSVTKETVQASVSIEYPSLDEMLSDSFFLEQNGQCPWRIEKDEQGRLKVSLTPGEAAKRQGERAEMVNYLMQNKMKMAFLLKLPGKVISSTLPDTKDATTGYRFDASAKDGAEAYLKTVTNPIVVVAELGGLKLDEPVESSDPYARRKPRQDAGANLTVAEAGPGWTAKACTVTTTTVFYFPGGREALLGPEGEEENETKPGILIQARLNAPQGRFLQSIAKAKVTKAEDDKGRPIELTRKERKSEPDEANEPDEDWEGGTVFGSENDGATGMDFHLRLGAPAPGASAVEKLEGTLEAVSFGGWKEHSIPSPSADPQKEIDLSELVPGAKLVVLKATLPQAGDRTQGHRSGSDEASVRVRVTGPNDVSELAFRLLRPGGREGRMQSYVNEHSSRRKGQQTVRVVDIQYQSWDEDNAAQPLTLQVRRPKDVKRERVKFTLDGVDLF